MWNRKSGHIINITWLWSSDNDGNSSRLEYDCSLGANTSSGVTRSRARGVYMRTRITIQTTEELDQALEETRVMTGRPTKSEVIRDSLELYDLVVQHLHAGKHLYLGETRETAGEVLLPHLERAAGRLRPHLVAVKTESDPVATTDLPVRSGSEAKGSSSVRKRVALSGIPSAKRRSPTGSTA